MHKQLFGMRLGAAFAAVLLAGVGFAGTAAQAAPVHAAAAPALPQGETAACAPVAGEASCASLMPAAGSTTVVGYGPADLQSAYGFATPELGNGATVAVVNAYGDGHVEGDLATYRSNYGLAACTTASGCLKVVNQTGGTATPAPMFGWTVATSQSVDVISAICPGCHILVVEANDSSLANLETAEDTAVSLGAKFITNTWVFPEQSIGSSEPDNDTHFNHPGVVITAPAGNNGFGTVEYPAASQYVVAVGGTELTPVTGGRDWSETVWPETGSGCSEFEPKPAWQTDTGCAAGPSSGRMLNDVSAVADGVAYYDTDSNGGWSDSGGTVVSAALVAAAYALGGPPAPGSYPSSYLYTHPGAFWGITGSNGTCTPSYWCTAGPGYNGPAGNGTPFADTAFSSAGARPAVLGNTAYVRLTDDSTESAWPILPGFGECPVTGCGNLTNLGGALSGYPATLRASNGSSWLFAVGEGNLYADKEPAGSSTWSGWTSLGAPSGLSVFGTPAVVQDGSGKIHVLVRDSTSGNLWEDALPSGSSTWSGFTSLGGTLPNDVAAVANGNGSIVVVGTGNDSALYYDELPSGGSWSGWTHIGTGGTAVTGIPAIVKDNSGNDHVFIRQSSNATLLTLALTTATGTWSGVTSLGGTWRSYPTALTGAGGTVWVFVLGTNGHVFMKQLSTNGTWNSWSDLGGTFTGQLGFAEDSTGMFYLNARGISGDLEENNIPSGSSTWSGWGSFGSLFTLAGS